MDVTKYLLDEAGLAIVPFYAFGASTKSPWYRLSVGTSVYEEIDELFTKLKDALQKLNYSLKSLQFFFFLTIIFCSMFHI